VCQCLARKVRCEGRLHNVTALGRRMFLVYNGSFCPYDCACVQFDCRKCRLCSSGLSGAGGLTLGAFDILFIELSRRWDGAIGNLPGTSTKPSEHAHAHTRTHRSTQCRGLWTQIGLTTDVSGVASQRNERKGRKERKNRKLQPIEPSCLLSCWT